MTKEELLKKIENIEITVDGGGDSGEVNIEGVEDQNLLNVLEDIVYDTIEYGSFAGDFQVNLTSGRDDEGITLFGEEISYEDVSNETIESVKIDIPKNLIGIIDSINIYASHNDGEQVRLNIKNGIWTDELEDFEQVILVELENLANSVISYDTHFIDKNYRINKSQKSIKIELEAGDYYRDEKHFHISYDAILEKLKELKYEEK